MLGARAPHLDPSIFSVSFLGDVRTAVTTAAVEKLHQVSPSSWSLLWMLFFVVLHCLHSKFWRNFLFLLFWYCIFWCCLLQVFVLPSSLAVFHLLEIVLSWCAYMWSPFSNTLSYFDLISLIVSDREYRCGGICWISFLFLFLWVYVCVYVLMDGCVLWVCMFKGTHLPWWCWF